MLEEELSARIIKKLISTMLVALLTLSFFVGLNLALAQENAGAAAGAEVVEEGGTGEMAEDERPAIPQAPAPPDHQTVELENVTGQAGWSRSSLATAGLKFMARGKEALAWTIGIEDAGFDNPAIESSYKTVLTIVNSLFILGLLGIAAIWMFSLVIPRHKLKRVILVYALAVVFVNFALPMTRLFIDGTNVLQRTLLTENNNPIGIVDIVTTPVYSDSVGFENKANAVQEATQKNVTLNLPGPAATPVQIGTLSPQNLTAQVLEGSLGVGVEGDPFFLTVPARDPQILALNTNQGVTATLEEVKAWNPNQEQTVFAFVLMGLTGLAYFLIALIFLLRIVILWALLILSPALFLFAIFEATRGYFLNWLGLYGRWLLIGPLVALGLSLIINIWQRVGLPITSTYGAGDLAENFGAVLNVRFLLPGSNTPNTLSTTPQMMEYILFLMMLYLPIFFGFVLTRSKTWMAANTVFAGTLKSDRRPRSGTKTVETAESKGEKPAPKGLVTGIKDFFGAQISKFTQTAAPVSTMRIPVAAAPSIPSASSFLPEQLALSSLPNMLELLGANKESRHSREQVIEKLSNPAAIVDATERKNVEAVRQEIDTRASQGNVEALVLQNEIQTLGGASTTQVEVTAPQVSSIPLEVKVTSEEKGQKEAGPAPQTLSAEIPTIKPAEETLKEEDDTIIEENQTNQKP